MVSLTPKIGPLKIKTLKSGNAIPPVHHDVILCIIHDNLMTNAPIKCISTSIKME